MPFSLHLGGAMRVLIEERNSGLYLCVGMRERERERKGD
jgi:hypothetical protein